MKIKIDFVTNSSSTSYLVCMPDDLELYLDNDLKKTIDDVEFMDDESIEKNVLSQEDYQRLYNRILKGFKDLKQNKIFYEGTDSPVFLCLSDYLGMKGYLVGGAPGSGNSYEGVISLIKKERIDKLFIALNKNLIKETSEFLEEK